MKNTKRFLTLLLALLMLGSTMAWAAEDVDVGNPVYSDKLSSSIYDYIYNNPARFEKPFEPGQVSVAFKLGVSISEDFDKVFPELMIEKVDVLMKSKDSKTGMPETRELVCIHLTVKTREAVIDAINYLKDNSLVYCAEPNYLLSPPEIVILDGPPIPGDVTLNEEVDNADLIIIARYLVNLVELNDKQMEAADYNGDGEVNNIELVLIGRELVRSFPK